MRGQAIPARGRYRRKPEHVPHRALVPRQEVPARIERADAVKPEDEKRHERAQYGAGVVGGCVKPECASPRFGDRGVGEQRITRGAADALSHPVGDANRQHLRRAVRRGGKWTRGVYGVRFA